MKPIRHRGVVTGTKGMVSSAHTLISASGLKVLERGGNAIDAAIAMALTSGAVLPDMCGLGADAFALVYSAEEKKIYALNGSGPAPKNISIKALKELGCKRMPNDGIHSVTVPGAVDTYFTMLEKWGTMSFRELAEDAIALAEQGVPISAKVVRHMHTDLNKMLSFPKLKETYLDHGRPYGFADVVRVPALAENLRYLSETGREGFYHGKIRDDILACSSEQNGFFTEADFDGTFCEITEPISVSYRNMRIYQTPPVSQGIIHLEEMGILSHFDMASFGMETAEAVHVMCEAKKIAFADRYRYFADPAYTDNPVERILSDAYTAQCAERIDPEYASQADEHMHHEDSHTTSFVAIDAYGNAVSFIHSIAGVWGSGLMPENCGFLLNNRGSGFSLDENDINCLQGSKRTMHTLNTWMIMKDDRLRFIGNTPGGDNQPQWNMQVIVNLIDHHMDVQEAVEHAKWADRYENGKHILRIEKQIGETELQKLKEKGHILEIIEPFTCSGASQVIEIRDDGVRLGGSDPRGDGAAMAQI